MFDSDLVLGGVIFNRIGGDSHNHWLKEAVESSGLGVTVLGGVPKVPHIHRMTTYLRSPQWEEGRGTKGF